MQLHCLKYVRKRVFFDPLFSRTRIESKILSLYEKIRVKENPYSGIFYEVKFFFASFTDQSSPQNLILFCKVVKQLVKQKSEIDSIKFKWQQGY